MTDAAVQRMTPEDFLEWCLDQEDTYELVDGVPVLKFDNGPEMMAGASDVHDQIVVNLISRLREALRGTACRVKTADQAARMPRGNVRRPDATIDCGPRDPKSYESIEPKVLFEVLSPSTRRIDLLKKTNEYQNAPTLAHFVLIEPAQVRVLVWTRAGRDSWAVEDLTDLDAALNLPAVGVSLPLNAIYEDVPRGEGR